MTTDTSSDICRKWVARLGLGFHPDTGGLDYDPPLSPNEVEEYNADMDALFAHPGCPYEAAITAWKDAGLLKDGEGCVSSQPDNGERR